MMKFNVQVFVEGGKLQNLGKNSRSNLRTNNKLNLLQMPDPGFKVIPQWWEVSLLTNGPTLLPQQQPNDCQRRADRSHFQKNNVSSSYIMFFFLCGSPETKSLVVKMKSCSITVEGNHMQPFRKSHFATQTYTCISQP